jgi:hypothetical protein
MAQVSTKKISNPSSIKLSQTDFDLRQKRKNVVILGRREKNPRDNLTGAKAIHD